MTLQLLLNLKEKKFEKNGGIQAYIDLLKQHKIYNPTYDAYGVIEWHSANDDSFIIQ